jgi:hypothetical protein
MQYTVQCTVGWVDFGLFYIFNKSTPEICYIPSKGTENNKQKFFDPVTSSFKILKIETSLSDKMQLKKVIQEKKN